MRSLVGAAVVPTAPLLLPEASADQPPEIRGEVLQLRRFVREALESLPAADVYVLVCSGPRCIHDRAAASLAPLGIADLEVKLPVRDDSVEHLSRLTQYPVCRGDPLDVDHSALALLLHEVCGLVPVLPLSVPPATDFDVLVSVGASIGEAMRDADTTAAVICAGDLSAGLHAGSPGWLIDGARTWDREVVAAVQRGDLRRLRDLGPAEAQRVGARGWAPLAVLHGVCAAGRLTPGVLTYLAPRGVGQLVATCAAGEEPGVVPFELRDVAGHEHDGVVRRTGDPRG